MAPTSVHEQPNQGEESMGTRAAAIRAEVDRLEYQVANGHVHAASTFTRMRDLLNQALALGVTRGVKASDDKVKNGTSNS
jgi:hypothetical protein